jgi:2-polyprenyl-3-methyl-5-hydroxy-6-metoxy-1,4-benzoquinol methylase
MRKRPGLETDRERWDRKFAAGEGPVHFEANQLLTQSGLLHRGGRALDVACGFGGNALYLASSGYRVDAIDASGVALAQAQAEARRRGLHINWIQADLTRWWIPPGRYDLISVFFYLNRALMPLLAAGLRPGGLLFQAGRNTRFLTIRPGFDPAFLLRSGELRQSARASGLEVLQWADGEHASTLVARQPL